MSQKDSPIIVGLDIGTTKIACIAGRKNEYGKLEILGFGRAQSNGVHHGQVLNIDETIEAIKIALGNCLATNPDLVIEDVYVGIAGYHIKSLQTRGDLVRQNTENEIRPEEIEQLIENQRKTFIPAGDDIIDVIPQDFHVDNIQNIKKAPVGYNGVKVGANFHIITGERNAIRNIKRAVDRSKLKTKELVLQPLASAAAVMSKEDEESTVAILDIGGGTSDLVVFQEGIIRHTAVIPFGGVNISEDIKKGLGVIKAQAEAMKVQFGSALSEIANSNAYITIPGIRGLPSREISVKNLSHIIQCRMTEILEMVTFHLKQISLDTRALNGGIILTGGGSQLANIVQLTEYVTGVHARIGLPNEHLAPNPAYQDELRKPVYSTCIGLILKGISDYEYSQKEFEDIFVPVQINADQLKAETLPAAPSAELPKTTGPAPVRQRSRFWDKFKSQLIDIFHEEDDQKLH